ncbi:MAG: tRNA pseudouridine synthase B, partial [Chloroflexota bacterium]
RPVEGLQRSDVEAALAAFRGMIEQRPPAYSAVSVGGRRLYDLARRGQAVEAPVRIVEITQLELVACQPPLAKLRVECSKGTYVRSLAHDLGRALGCGAHLSGLVRLRAGGFLAHNATPLSELEERLRDGRWQAIAIPPDAAVAHLMAVQLDDASAERLSNGLPIPAEGNLDVASSMPSGTLGRVYAADGRFVAVARLVRLGERGGRLVWKPEKVFRA